MAIRVGILGYGNLGSGVELALQRQADMELVGIYTRRNPATIHPLTNASVYSITALDNMVGKLDVLAICSGSKDDLPIHTPKYAEMFNVVDSFDTHDKTNRHFADVDAPARKSGHTAIISVGWDPDLFSKIRLLGNVILNEGPYHSTWGDGVSQGHSDAIRRIPGVKDARQYTRPIPEMVDIIRTPGNKEQFNSKQLHIRECFVVAEEGADLAEIERRIVTMPDYFEGYTTTVHFITEEELHRDHDQLYHAGEVICTGQTGLQNENSHLLQFTLKTDSNPQLTGSIMAPYLRAAYYMNQRGEIGCHDVFHVCLADLSPLSDEELRKKYL